MSGSNFCERNEAAKSSSQTAGVCEGSVVAGGVGGASVGGIDVGGEVSVGGSAGLGIGRGAFFRFIVFLLFSFLSS